MTDTDFPLSATPWLTGDGGSPTGNMGWSTTVPLPGERTRYPVNGKTPPTLGQLALELFVRDLERSRRFYVGLGFQQGRVGTRFAEFTWDNATLFLYQPPLTRWAHCGEVDDSPRTNLRVFVTNIEKLWRRVLEQGLRVLEPLVDKPYGLRDFMIADPDGFGLRFASPIAGPTAP